MMATRGRESDPVDVTDVTQRRSATGLSSVTGVSSVGSTVGAPMGAPTDEGAVADGDIDHPPRATRRFGATRALTGLVRVYQMSTAGRPSPCRHVPSCSTYAIEAIEAHGPAVGVWLAAKRLGRCHPWGTSGYDPVPEPRRSRSGTVERDET